MMQAAPLGIESNASSETAPEQVLFACVILRAFLDALGPSGTYQSDHIQDSARLWLTGNGRDFGRVCDCAGFEPSLVLSVAQEWARNGWPTSAIRELSGAFGRWGCRGNQARKLSEIEIDIFE